MVVEALQGTPGCEWVTIDSIIFLDDTDKQLPSWEVARFVHGNPNPRRTVTHC